MIPQGWQITRYDAKIIDITPLGKPGWRAGVDGPGASGYLYDLADALLKQEESPMQRLERMRPKATPRESEAIERTAAVLRDRGMAGLASEVERALMPPRAVPSLHEVYRLARDVVAMWNGSGVYPIHGRLETAMAKLAAAVHP